MTPTPADLLTRHAPRLDDAEDPALEAVLARTLTDVGWRRAVPTSRVRRRLLLGAGVAAVTTGAVVLPAALRRDDAGVQALQRLAATAAQQPGLVVVEGSYLHRVTVDNPRGGSLITGDGADVYPRTLESWSAADGTLWRHDRDADGTEQFWRFDPASSVGTSLDTSPRTLESLPTEPAALEQYLRPRVGRSASADAAMFVYLRDALGTGYAPPSVQRAMIATLARLPDIETSRSLTQDGRPCLRVGYAEPLPLGLGQYACFDEATAALVEEGARGGGYPDLVSVVILSELVDSVPADVVSRSADTPQG